MTKLSSDESISPCTDTDMDPRTALWPTYAPPKELVFSHGCGSELFTNDGKVYLDFVSGIAVTSFGHAHPRLVAALSDQSAALWHLSNLFRIPAAETLAQRLVQHSFGDRVFFTNSGTEACEAGIKAMRGFHAFNGRPERYRVIGFTGAFHGRTLGAVAAAGNPAHTQGFIPFDYGFDHVPWGDLEALEASITAETAGIIVEPIRGEGGVSPLSSEFMSTLKALCQHHNILLMFDEVQCGIGRSGKLFAHEHLGVTPDIMALAKGLGSGFPVGACVATEEVASAMTVGKHGTTYGGNPLAMTVANTVLDLVLEPGVLEDITRKGQLLRDLLSDLIERYPHHLKNVTGKGLMVGLECVIPNTELITELRQQQLLVAKAGGNSLRILPPLNVTDAHIHQALETLADVLAAWPVSASK